MSNFLDFGSGYNPKKNWKTCDIYGYVDYYFDPIEYKIDADDNIFDGIMCRNVIHHIKDLNKLSKEFSRVMKSSSSLFIIESNKEHYSSNYYLDYLWYRYIIPRYEIWFSNEYRDCRNYFNQDFDLFYYGKYDEKELFIFTKKMDIL